MWPAEGRQRAIIEAVTPEIDGGRYAIKRTVGEYVVVEADIFADGHDQLSAVLSFRQAGATDWEELFMEPIGNDRWRAQFQVTQIGQAFYRILAWVDPFQTWQQDLHKRVAAEQDVAVELLIGAELVERAAQAQSGDLAAKLRNYAQMLRQGGDPAIAIALSPTLGSLMQLYGERRFVTAYPERRVWVDPEKARFSTWYELFPRSCGPDEHTHGTFQDVIARLPLLAEMGFDVLYLPPIHPIGRTFRKGKNNSMTAEPEDVGSPWAIGGPEGGHKAIHPQLGSLEDFHRLVAEAKKLNIDIALDIAFQCSPDHPYVKEHPEWFRKRPDGTIQYAENPPKKYQDIYPLDFETENWQALWEELKSVIEYWIDQGVTIFRVDNPHTKAFGFWEWCIGQIKAKHPQTIFLSEAFTRPKLMKSLAKLGFTQSYTYFTWRNDKWGLTEYFTELTQTPMREYYRPNLWPNTPDILNEFLQKGGRPAFMLRLILAATLGASYGIYGPAFELCENRPLRPGSEEYLDSEKYQIRHWDLDTPDNLRPLIAQVNRIRRQNPALQSDWSLVFHPTDNEALICYSKRTFDGSNRILVAVNLDPFHIQSGWVTLNLGALGLEHWQTFKVIDLLDGQQYSWQGSTNYIKLDPWTMPAHIFLIES
ncbi:alpha-1,4-glucan--maltose-1-phosphate maltosyltransferase [Synechococcus sp. H60.4]|uniref:alpha-1,4-glucan--maltose-1-phosphate maltosyltransferase n=1 Tax=unclassified Synechococcus TaxID=2626047 RepID=UPI0039C28C2F